MNTLINRQLFTQKTFDSGALGPMTSVIHQFARPGRYQASIRKQGAAVGTFSFLVDEKSEAMQLDIDLATVTSRKAGAKMDDCDCHSQALPVVSPKGYVIFFASSGSGYSVQAGNEESKEAEFDSEKLKEGDLFALTLLEPTRYSMVNQLADAKGEIGVSFTPEDAKKLKLLQAQYVETRKGKFDPPKVKLVSTQGLVFRIGSPSRIIIEKTGSADSGKAKAKRGPVRHWEKPKQPSSAK